MIGYNLRKLPIVEETKQPEKEEIMQESVISREKSKNHIILQSREKAN